MFFELNIDLDPEGRELTEQLEAEFSDETEKVIRDVVRFAPVELRRAMQNSPACGRKYRRASGEGFQRFHVASSQGNALRNDSGAASRSFKGRMTGKLEGEISTNWYVVHWEDLGRTTIEQAFTDSIERAI